MSVILGKVYVHKYTGFTGRAVYRTQFLYGCVRVALQSDKLVDNKIAEVTYLDEIELIDQENDPIIQTSNLLGKIDTDKITGFTGTITSYTDYLSQGPRVYLTPKGTDRDGKPIEPYLVDIPQLINANRKEPMNVFTSGPGKCADRMGISSRM